MNDPYEVLQVNRRAEPEVIRAAFRALARKYHPDFGGDSARMVEITEAYSILGTADRRAAYDAQGARAHTRRSTDRTTSSAPVPSAAAASAAPNRPGSGSVIDFGRYAGWTVGSLVNHDPDYLEWLARTPIGRRLTAEIEVALSQRAAQTAALRPSPKLPQRRSFIRPWATAGSAAR